MWPSSIGKVSTFCDFIEMSVFKPSINASVTVRMETHATEDFPLSQCADCVARFQGSGPLTAVSEVRRSLVNTSMYDHTRIVSHIKPPSSAYVSLVLHCILF